MQQLQDLQGKAATILHASCASPWSINILIQTHDAQVCPAKQCGRSPVWQKLRMPPASALAHRLAVICQARACCPQRHCRCPQRIWKMSCRLGNRPKHPVPDTGLSCQAMWKIARLAETLNAPSKRFGASPCCHLPGAGMLASKALQPQRIWKMSCRLGNRPKHPVPDTGHANLGAQTSWIRGVCSTKLAPHPAGGVYHCWHRCRHNSDASAARG